MGKSVLITGPAGSGKTAHCLRICREALRKSEPGRVIYLVPSAQAVRDTERELLLAGELRGLLGSPVMDFVALASRILNDAGCFPVRRIGLLERRYLILRIIRDTPLSFFSDVKDYDGFAEVVGDFIAELKRGMISPQDFLDGCRGATGRSGIPAEKVSELHAIYNAYHDELSKRAAYDGDGLQWMAAEALAQDTSLLSSLEVLLVDGFATYTPVELEMLSLLLARASESHLTLCYQHGRPQVFGFVEGTYGVLKKLCTGREVVFFGPRPIQAQLIHLERSLFTEAPGEVQAGNTVAIFRCHDAHREVETVAREIEKIRSQDALTYGDFTVVLRDIGEYGRLISEVFSERRIPFFIPSPMTLAEDPFIRVLLSALRLASGEFHHEVVVALLNNSYLSTDPDLAAHTENYVDEFGLWDEELFRQRWTEIGAATRDVNRLNDCKNNFLAALDGLRRKANSISSAEEFRDFVFQTVRELGFFHRVEQINQDSHETVPARGTDSRPLLAGLRALGALASLLDSICEYARLTDLRRANCGLFLDMLQRGLSWLPLPSPPRELKSVRVASVAGGHPLAAPVVFICGMCERSFPKEIVNEPFFRDRERRLIRQRRRINLEERTPLSAGERFFFYMAVTRATRRLILTYPCVDSSGRELACSHYVDQVAALFSDLRRPIRKESPQVKQVPDFTDISDVGELRFFIAHQLSRRVGEAQDRWDESLALAALAYNELVEKGHLRPRDMIYQPPVARASLPEELLRSFPQKDAYLTSVSELETFGRCPFRHFCQYRLRLEEPRRYQFGHAEEGTLYHEVLTRLYREIYLPDPGHDDGSDQKSSPQPGRIETIPPDDLRRRLDLMVDEFINSAFPRLFRGPRMEVRRRAIKARIGDFLVKEIENECANATRPTYFELSFGRGKSPHGADPHSTTKCLALAGENVPPVHISGRIDRVDVYDEHTKEFGVVLDYKRSELKGRTDLARGTVLQAGIYMLALKELFGINPAGAFYYSIAARRKRGIFAAEEEELISGAGDVSRKDAATYRDIAGLIALNSRQALDYVRRILAGDIRVTPATPDECRACPFLSICRISEAPPTL